MSEHEYNELFRAIGKEAFANMIKADIRSRVPNLMQVCIVNNLMISRMLQISLNLQLG